MMLVQSLRLVVELASAFLWTIEVADRGRRFDKGLIALGGRVSLGPSVLGRRRTTFSRSDVASIVHVLVMIVATVTLEVELSMVDLDDGIDDVLERRSSFIAFFAQSVTSLMTTWTISLL